MPGTFELTNLFTSFHFSGVASCGCASSNVTKLNQTFCFEEAILKIGLFSACLQHLLCLAGHVEVMSMHSIVTQSTAPSPQKKQLSGLNARAVEAAMKHVMAAKGSEQGSQRRFSKQASARRISTERGGSSRPILGPKAESRYMFSPATADISGYRQKHGVTDTSAVRV